MVELTGKQRPVLELLAEYSRGIPCLTDALVKANKVGNRALGGQGPYLTASIDLFVDRPSYTFPEDAPSNPDSDANNANLPRGISSWAPHCPYVPERFRQLSGDPGSQTAGRAATNRPAGGSRPDADSRLANAMAARLLDTAPEQVPPLAGLMLSPMLRGGEVSVP
ncbi:MAG: hypothetical protein GEV04_23365 [Actinophytocola sp.]|nr:hypothetical protein [Actinophytocola sp.]